MAPCSSSSCRPGSLWGGWCRWKPSQCHMWVIGPYSDVPDCAASISVLRVRGRRLTCAGWSERRCPWTHRSAFHLTVCQHTAVQNASQRRAKMSGSASAGAKLRKDESFLGKLGGTLVRKKRAKEGGLLCLFLLWSHHERPSFCLSVRDAMITWPELQ